jgi:hypothetical protein
MDRLWRVDLGVATLDLAVAAHLGFVDALAGQTIPLREKLVANDFDTFGAKHAIGQNTPLSLANTPVCFGHR